MKMTKHRWGLTIEALRKYLMYARKNLYTTARFDSLRDARNRIQDFNDLADTVNHLTASKGFSGVKINKISFEDVISVGK